MVSGLITSVTISAITILARAGSASNAATNVCATGMIGATNRPSATARGTDRRLKCHRSGFSKRSAKGASQRLAVMVSRVGICPRNQCAMLEKLTAMAASTLVTHDARGIALPVLFLLVLTFVLMLAPLGERQFDLRAAPAVEIDRQRNQRHALARHRLVQFGDFTFMQQQPAGAFRLMVFPVAVTEFRDGGIDQ